MRPDNTSNTNRPTGKSSDKIQDLKEKNVKESDANRVKGGFNPQPDPPAKSGGLDRTK